VTVLIGGGGIYAGNNFVKPVYIATAKVSWIDRTGGDGQGTQRLISQATDVLTSREIPLLAAADPAQPYGAALPWPERPGEAASSHRPGRKAGALTVLVDGALVLYVERGGRTLLTWSDDAECLRPAALSLSEAGRRGALGRMTVEKADGEQILGGGSTPLREALDAAGFVSTPRGLRLRG